MAYFTATDDDLSFVQEAMWRAAAEGTHPNCTAYLIWFYLQRGDYQTAESEFVRDSDKISSTAMGTSKRTVLTALQRLVGAAQ